VRDELEGRQFQGAMLESFRDPKTRSIRVRGGGFTVLIAESGDVAIYYPDRVVRIAPGTDVVVEPKLTHDIDAQSPRAAGADRKRGSR
jgi:hypothetical protein